VQVLSVVHEHVARFAAGYAGRARAVLDDAAKRTVARIAVAEVQRHHAVWSMAQLRFEVHRALPVLSLGADGEAAVTEVATLAVSGRAGTDVVQVTAPDITDVTGLGVRASDGGSIYRPPHEERYCTLPQLDTEEQILTAAKRSVSQLVSQEHTYAAAEHTDLSAEQRDAVVTMLTATTAMTVLIAPAGAGKSHTMAGFARLWTSFTGRRVIGLTTSTNAARVLAHEGLAESYNIAEFLGKIEGSDELRPCTGTTCWSWMRPARSAPRTWRCCRKRPGRPRRGSSRLVTPPSLEPWRPGECSGCSPRRSPQRSYMRSAGSTRRGSGRPASGSAAATWPRSPPTTGMVASGPLMRRPSQTVFRGSPLSCSAKSSARYVTRGRRPR
jgi:AAA domain